MTLYQVKKSKVGKTTTVEVPCPKSATQACANYYSVIKAGRSAEFVCTKYHNINGRLKSPATESWRDEHKDDTWKTFTSAKYDYDAERKDLVPNCQIDEWPPAYFLSENQMQQGTANTRGQLVRWIPELPNNDGGKLWNAFCKKYDGDEGNGQRAPRVNNAQWKEDDE